jgi:hypothetical protein
VKDGAQIEDLNVYLVRIADPVPSNQWALQIKFDRNNFSADLVRPDPQVFARTLCEKLDVVISSIPQLGGSPSEPVPGAHWSASPPEERQRCLKIRSNSSTVCP